MKFTLPAPASVEWYRPGVAGGGQNDRIFNRVKAKLIGGKDDSGTSYFKLHDRSLSSSDADKIIANMKQDEDGYPMLQTGSTSGEAEREYQEWIIDRYLVDTPKTTQEPEEIPVEIEVVEVEQKEPDEPIVVRVEAPFENPETTGAPRRVKLPRVRNTIPKSRINRQQKKDAATRMAESFDNRLDDLLDNIRNPDPGSPPKVRKKKEVLIKKSKKVKASFGKSDDPWKAKTLSSFVGLKLKKSFGRAAEARRIAKEQGADEKGRVHYLTKALGFEFGGDRINRLQGTFSKSPVAAKDPALSADQRFLAGINSDITPPPTKQGELFNTNQYTTKTGVSKVVSDGINKLQSSFERVDNKFRNLIETKKSSVQSDLSKLSSVVDDLKKSVLKNVDTQNKINDVKQQQLDLLFDIAQDDKVNAKEASMEKGSDLSDNLFNENGLEPPEKQDDGGGDGPDPFKWLKNLKKWGRRLKNPGKTWKAIKRLTKQKLKKIPGVKGVNNWMKNKKPFQGLRNIFGGNKATNAVKAVDAAGDTAKAARGGGFLSRAGGILNKIPGKGMLGAAAKSPVGKTVSRFLPGANVVIGGALTASRLAEGDYLGAALAAGSMIPGPIGWGFLAGELLGEGGKMLASKNRAAYEERNDPANVMSGLGFSSGEPKSVMPSDGSIPQLVQGSDRRNIFEKMRDGYQNWIYGTEKMSEGGTVKLADGGVNAMIGEAGPEMLLRNGMGAVNPLQSLAPMILAAREVTKRAGTWADPIENFVRQTTDPIAKSLNLPVSPMETEIGKGSIPQIEDKKEEGTGPLGWLAKLFKKRKKKIGKKGSRSSGISPVPVTGIPLGPGQTAKAGELVAGLMSRGFTREESAAIVGNLWAESGFNTGAVNPDSGAFGLMQWLGGRKNKLIAFAREKGKDVKDIGLQLDYIAWELKGGNQYETSQFQKAMAYGPDIASKTRGFAHEVERAGAHELAASMSKRIGAGESAFNASAGAAAPPAVPVAQQPVPPQPLLPPTQPSVLTLPLLSQAPPASQPSSIFSYSQPQTSALPFTSYEELRRLSLGVR